MEKPVTLLQKQIEENVNLPLVVPAKLTKPDDLIIEAERSLTIESESKWNFRSLIAPRGNNLNICVMSENVPRALRFMDTFIKLLRARGHDIYVKNGKTLAIINDIELKICFREKTERREIPNDKWNRTERVPTGILTFRLEDLFHEKMWKDGTVPIEDQLSKILAHLEIVSIKTKERKALWQKEREEQEVIAAEKRKIKRRKELESIALGRLLNDASRYYEAQKIRAYVNAIESKAISNSTMSEGLKEWTEWARKKAELIELSSERGHDENMINLALEMSIG